MLVTLPVVMLASDAWSLQRWTRQSAWRVVIEKAPLFALAGRLRSRRNFRRARERDKSSGVRY